MLFISREKLFSFSRYFFKSKYIFDFLVMFKNGLIRKIRLISKFMTSQSGKQAIAIRICAISQEVKAIRQ